MKLLRHASRWIFLAALVYAPWTYGGTTSASIQIINWLLLAAITLWIVELVISGRRPVLPRFLLFLAVALIGIGGWMTLNAISIYDSDFHTFVPLRNFAPHLTGSIDYTISTAWIVRGALLLCATLFVADLSQSNRWLLRLWYTIGLVAGSIAFLLPMFALGWASHLEQPLNRWQTLSQSVSNDARWLAWRAAVGALPDTGFFGFGPGTFRVVFPFYNSVAINPAPGTWRFLHEDYLQTALEWGWLGSGLWGLLFFGGMVIAIRRYKNPSAQDWTPRRRLLQPFVILALAGVALHALLDFPLQIASVQLYVATYLGLCWGSSRWEKASAKEGRAVHRTAPAIEVT